MLATRLTLLCASLHSPHGEQDLVFSSIILLMEGSHPSLRRFAELLMSILAQAGVSMPEVDRRLAWKDGTLKRILSSGLELRVSDLLDVLRVTGIEERSFFASLYGLEPRCRSMSEQPRRRIHRVPRTSQNRSEV